ncbi:hypothetical protein FD754_002304, partial [Muntiacus muntjak]
VTSDIGKAVLTTKVLLGNDEAILLTLAMKDKNIEVVKTVKKVIQTCQVW